MFSLCLSVCLLAKWRRKYSTNFHKIRWKGGARAAEEPIRFWWESRITQRYVRFRFRVRHGLKWGRVARFDLPGLYRVSCLLSCSSKSHKIPLRMHQNSLFSDKNKFCGGGTRPRIAGETLLLFWTTLSTEVGVAWGLRLTFHVIPGRTVLRLDEGRVML